MKKAKNKIPEDALIQKLIKMAEKIKEEHREKPEKPAEPSMTVTKIKNGKVTLVKLNGKIKEDSVLGRFLERARHIKEVAQERHQRIFEAMRSLDEVGNIEDNPLLNAVRKSTEDMQERIKTIVEKKTFTDNLNKIKEQTFHVPEDLEGDNPVRTLFDAIDESTEKLKKVSEGFLRTPDKADPNPSNDKSNH